MAKRLLLGGLMAAIILLALTGCSSGGGGAPKGTVVLHTGAAQARAVSPVSRSVGDEISFDLRIDIVGDGISALILEGTYTWNQLTGLGEYTASVNTGTYTKAVLTFMGFTIGGTYFAASPPMTAEAPFSAPLVVAAGQAVSLSLLYGSLDLSQLNLGDFELLADLFDIELDEDDEDGEDGEESEGNVTLQFSVLAPPLAVSTRTETGSTEAMADIQIQLVPAGITTAQSTARCESPLTIFSDIIAATDFSTNRTRTAEGIPAGTYSGITITVYGYKPASGTATTAVRTEEEGGWVYDDANLPFTFPLSFPAEHMLVVPADDSGAGFKLLLNQAALTTLQGWTAEQWSDPNVVANVMALNPLVIEVMDVLP